MTEYYVAKIGNDTNIGTEIEPWLTIQKAADTLVAGDTVYIKEGTYNEKVTPLNLGSAGNYITYTAYPNHIASIDGTGLSVYPSGLFRIENKNYIIILGLKIKNYGDTGACHGINILGSDHIIIENNYVNNTGGCGIYAHVSSSNIIIDNNEVSYTNLDPAWDQEMISLVGVDTFIIKNNHVHHSDNIAIDAKSGSSNGKIFKNYIHDTDSGIYTDAFASYEHDIDIYQNIAHDIVYNCYQAGTEEGGTLENIRFFNNIGYGATYYGFKVHSYAGSKINITVINNVFHNCDDLAMLITGSETDFENFVIRNNILNGEDWHLLHFPSYTGSPDISIDHNLFSGISNLYGDDYIIGNPKFVNPSAADFHLQVDSPAIDEGSAVGAPNVDFDGVSRPQGAGYDIGAYEFVGEPPTPTCTQNFIVYDQEGNPVSGGWTVYATVTDPDTDVFIEEKTCVVGLDGRCSIQLNPDTHIQSHARANGERTTGYSSPACFSDLIDLWQLVGCDTPTPNHASGCELLLRWDKDNDGIISHAEMMDAILAAIDCKGYDGDIVCPEPISDAEANFITDCYNNFAGVISDMCPGCVYVADICSWITGLGGWEAITSMNALDLLKARLGIINLGFTVTSVHRLGVLNYRLNDSVNGDLWTGCTKP